MWTLEQSEHVASGTIEAAELSVRSCRRDYREVFLFFKTHADVCGEDEESTEDVKQEVVGELESLRTAYDEGVVAFLPVCLLHSLMCITSCR